MPAVCDQLAWLGWVPGRHWLGLELGWAGVGLGWTGLGWAGVGLGLGLVWAGLPGWHSCTGLTRGSLLGLHFGIALVSVQVLLGLVSEDLCLLLLAGPLTRWLTGWLAGRLAG